MELKEFRGFATFLMCLLSFVVGMYIVYYKDWMRWAIALVYVGIMLYVFIKKRK